MCADMAAAGAGTEQRFQRHPQKSAAGPILVEWCVFLTPLESFFKDNNPLQSRFRVSPHPSPHGEGH